MRRRTMTGFEDQHFMMLKLSDLLSQNQARTDYHDVDREGRIAPAQNSSSFLRLQDSQLCNLADPPRMPMLVGHDNFQR